MAQAEKYTLIKMFISRVLIIRFERLMALKTRQALIFHVLTAERYRINFKGIYDVTKIRYILLYSHTLDAGGQAPPRILQNVKWYL